MGTATPGLKPAACGVAPASPLAGARGPLDGVRARAPVSGRPSPV